MACRALSLSVFPILTILAFGLVTGCPGGRRGGGLPRDSGTAPVDSGVSADATTPPDSGIMLMDSGTVPGCDPACPVGQTCNASGVCITDPECSASRPCPSGQTCNASGMCITDTMTCTGDTVMYNTGAFCGSSTG
ncbi:MAG: hypothetical protein JRH11_05510, partial [Deltaproteobacteria bacterium]|nr:hypothetical protein [Deltaproteobacteria bacterium]